jgi:hypothetical protein
MTVCHMSYREHTLRKMERRLEPVEEGKEERAVEHVISTEQDTKYESSGGLFANDIYGSDHIVRMNSLIHSRTSQRVSHIFTAVMQVLKFLSKIYKNYRHKVRLMHLI